MHANSSLRMQASPGLIERLDAWLYLRRQRALERYLATSVDAFQLETRMRDLDRPPRAAYQDF
jgi:hypothetical protein